MCRVFPVLDAVQLGVHPVEGQQLLVGPFFCNHTVFDHHDLVGVTDGAQSMRDAKNGAALHQPFQGFDHQMFGLRIEGCGGFVKNQDRVVADESAGNPDALALSAGERRATLANQAVVTVAACG